MQISTKQCRCNTTNKPRRPATNVYATGVLRLWTCLLRSKTKRTISGQQKQRTGCHCALERPAVATEALVVQLGRNCGSKQSTQLLLVEKTSGVYQNGSEQKYDFDIYLRRHLKAAAVRKMRVLRSYAALQSCSPQAFARNTRLIDALYMGIASWPISLDELLILEYGLLVYKKNQRMSQHKF